MSRDGEGEDAFFPKDVLLYSPDSGPFMEETEVGSSVLSWTWEQRTASSQWSLESEASRSAPLAMACQDDSNLAGKALQDSQTVRGGTGPEACVPGPDRQAQEEGKDALLFPDLHVQPPLAPMERKAQFLKKLHVALHDILAENWGKKLSQVAQSSGPTGKGERLLGVESCPALQEIPGEGLPGERGPPGADQRHPNNHVENSSEMKWLTPLAFPECLSEVCEQGIFSRLALGQENCVDCPLDACEVAEEGEQVKRQQPDASPLSPSWVLERANKNNRLWTNFREVRKRRKPRKKNPGRDERGRDYRGPAQSAGRADPKTPGNPFLNSSREACGEMGGVAGTSLMAKTEPKLMGKTQQRTCQQKALPTYPASSSLCGPTDPLLLKRTGSRKASGCAPTGCQRGTVTATSAAEALGPPGRPAIPSVMPVSKTSWKSPDQCPPAAPCDPLTLTSFSRLSGEISTEHEDLGFAMVPKAVTEDDGTYLSDSAEELESAVGKGVVGASDANRQVMLGLPARPQGFCTTSQPRGQAGLGFPLAKSSSKGLVASGTSRDPEVAETSRRPSRHRQNRSRAGEKPRRGALSSAQQRGRNGGSRTRNVGDREPARGSRSREEEERILPRLPRGVKLVCYLGSGSSVRLLGAVSQAWEATKPPQLEELEDLSEAGSEAPSQRSQLPSCWAKGPQQARGAATSLPSLFPFEWEYQRIAVLPRPRTLDPAGSLSDPYQVILGREEQQPAMNSRTLVRSRGKAVSSASDEGCETDGSSEWRCPVGGWRHRTGTWMRPGYVDLGGSYLEVAVKSVGASEIPKREGRVREENRALQARKDVFSEGEKKPLSQLGRASVPMPAEKPLNPAEPKVREQKRRLPKEKPPSAPGPSLQLSGEQVRSAVAESLREVLLKRLQEPADLAVGEEAVRGIAANIEAAIFELMQCTDYRYKTKYRSLVFNLRDPRNKDLFLQVIRGDITPQGLVRMSATELASQELAEWRDREVKHGLEIIEKQQREAPRCRVTKVTHKGEIEIHPDVDQTLTLEDLTEPASRLDLSLRPQPGAAESQSGRDTTEQHESHFLDPDCRVCMGWEAPRGGRGFNAPRSTPLSRSRVTSNPQKLPSPASLPRVDTSLPGMSKSRTGTQTQPQDRPELASCLRQVLKPKALQGQPLWEGALEMFSIKRFTTKAFLVHGYSSQLIQALPKVIYSAGCVLPEAVWDYLDSIWPSEAKDVSVVRLCPRGARDAQNYNMLYSYLNNKQRYGMVASEHLDMFLVPLPAFQPVPPKLRPLGGPEIEGGPWSLSVRGQPCTFGPDELVERSAVPWEKTASGLEVTHCSLVLGLILPKVPPPGDSRLNGASPLQKKRKTVTFKEPVETKCYSLGFRRPHRVSKPGPSWAPESSLEGPPAWEGISDDFLEEVAGHVEQEQPDGGRGPYGLSFCCRHEASGPGPDGSCPLGSLAPPDPLPAWGQFGASGRIRGQRAQPFVDGVGPGLVPLGAPLHPECGGLSQELGALASSSWLACSTLAAPRLWPWPQCPTCSPTLRLPTATMPILTMLPPPVPTLLLCALPLTPLSSLPGKPCLSSSTSRPW
uniref:LOW QUALITY PROTEIN: SPOC domain-containing protein 1 n=1 Tax=Phascolarctos cinereus TaxID=38626 RepID=A0A6P5K0N2_PHACI|nr:LOW QUALITY PROTEIN: SPOC domain-containing protein 1 [Phascolarctos cinereus]